MNLLRAETSRLFARRFTWVMLAIVVSIMGMIVLGVTLNSRPPTPQALAQAERDADQSRAEVARMRAECERTQSDSTNGPEQFPPGLDCAQEFNPDNVATEHYLPYAFTFHKEASILLGVCGGVIALFGFAVGASFVGAEWSSSGMANLLLWQPRRIRVLLTKLGAVLAAVLGLGTALAVVFLGALWLVAEFRGITSGAPAGFWQSFGLSGLRALTLGLATTTIGFALASIGRHTATALGVGVAYLIVGQIGLPVVLSLTEVARPERFFLSSYVAAWLNNGLTMQDYTHCDFESPTSEPCVPVTWEITMGTAAGIGGLILVALLGYAVLQMVRRDVT